MGIENPVHLLFIAAVALIVLGPKRLPALARALGQAVREFRASLEEGADAAEPQSAVEHTQALPVGPQAPGAEPVADAGSAPYDAASSSAALRPE